MIETLLISDLFLVVDVVESAWNIEIEDKLIKDLKAFVGLWVPLSSRGNQYRSLN